MAIDQTVSRSKSVTRPASSSAATDPNNIAHIIDPSGRVKHFVARQHRIERWAFKDRSSAISDLSVASSAVIGTATGQKRSESTYTHIGRKLDLYLLQLSEQRQKVIERRNFDQKFFANRQAVKHKDNPAVLKTFSYVQKCCKFAIKNENEEDQIDPKALLEEGSTPKRSRSRSPATSATSARRSISLTAQTQTSASLADTFLKHNQKHIQPFRSSPINRKLTASKTTSDTPTVIIQSETSTDDDVQKRHVQFRINADGKYVASQSAHVMGKSNLFNNDQSNVRNVCSASDIQQTHSSYDNCTSVSAPIIRTGSSSASYYTNEDNKTSSKLRRSLAKISSPQGSLQEFRTHPERFLSPSNRYLPLLQRKTSDTDPKDKSELMRRRQSSISPPFSRLSDGSDLTYDEAKSFLSDDADLGRSRSRTPSPSWLPKDRKQSKKARPSSKMSTTPAEVADGSEHKLAMGRYREREFARLNELIHSNQIERILEPFSNAKAHEQISVDVEQTKVVNAQPPANVKHSDQPPSKAAKLRQLNDIIHSIDSLRCSDTVERHARRRVDLEKNRAKLGILIF